MIVGSVRRAAGSDRKRARPVIIAVGRWRTVPFHAPRALVAVLAERERFEFVRATFGDHEVPSTLLGVTILGDDGQLVEVEAIAAVHT